METNNFKAALDAGAASVVHRELPGAAPYVLVPDGYNVESLESLLPKPQRVKQVVLFGEAPSFARYIQDRAGETTAIFAMPSDAGGRFEAVLDYHVAKGDPSWCEHRAIFDCPFSQLWKLWKASDNKYLPQREFAEFLETNTAQLVEPSAAEFLEIAQSLTARSSVAFTGSTRLDSGRDQIAFEATTEAKAGEKGNLTVPPLFTIGLPVFEGGPGWKLKARLRHRITEAKKLELKYELVNPQLTVREAWDEQVKIIRTATKIEPYIGRV